ncbi:MAG: polymerase subunit sigma-24 [Frankiales bacterium]|nr:polymerase subunit sigma-24 [Frankiales bacterium]
MTVDARELVVLPPVSDDPVFSAVLPDPAEAGAASPRAIGSDPHDFAALYMRHRWSFALHARRFLSDQRDIDEVVQEGFLKLFLAMPELETELQALSYARRTITNLCIDRYRADQRRPRLVDLETAPADVFVEDEEIDPVVAAEDAAIVREALAQLSPLHREALLKREVEEKPLPQIAAELDIPVEQVKHVLHRARGALRRLLVGTHVQPGVDLDFAIVLAANKHRAKAAAKPTGAAVVAVLLVLAGVVGLRSSGSHARPVAELPPSSGLPGLLDGTLPHGVSPAIATPAVPATPAAPRPPHVVRHAAPSKPRTHVPLTPAAGAPGHTPSTPPVPSAPAGSGSGPTTGTGGGGSGSGVAPVSHLALSGLLGATSRPSIQGAATFTHTSGTEAAFTQFVAPTIQGTVVVAQTLSSAQDGSLTYAADAALPVAGASVPAQLGDASQQVTRNADGTVGVTLSTSFSLPITDAGGLPSSDRFVVQALYASDLTTVLAERVVVGGPDDPLPTLTTPPTSAGGVGGDITPDGARVRPVPTSTDVSPGRDNPVGRDQEPLPSS